MKNNGLSIRITTGTAKNKKIKAPEIPDFRAVQEVAKSSLFSILGDKVIGAYCLDMFAGSGNLGIEALSRGAKSCDFVDESYEAIKTINENLLYCGLENKGEVMKSNSVKYAANTEKKYNIIFVDPFYHDIAHVFLMKNLEEILEKNGVICFFHGKELDMRSLIKDTGLQLMDQRKYGKSFLSLIQ
jgi:16S rRNA (guanine(966)-N(2))-methyltransferase RsmD